MKKYIDFKKFKEILKNIKLDEEIVFYSEPTYILEDGSIDKTEAPEGYADQYHFKMINFCNANVTIYEVPQTQELGLIQDTTYHTIDEAIAEVWELMTWNEEYKVYIIE